MTGKRRARSGWFSQGTGAFWGALGAACLFFPSPAHAAETAGQPLIWRGVSYFLHATHVAEVVVRRFTPQPGEMNRRVEFSLVKNLRGTFQEAPGKDFAVNAKVFSGPIRGLPVEAANALWRNEEPVPGRHYYFFTTRSDPQARVSIAALLQDFQREKAFLDDFSGSDGLALWAWDHAAVPPNSDWVAEISAAGEKQLKVRLLWVHPAPDPAPHVLFPEKVLNNAMFSVEVRNRAGSLLPLRNASGDWAAGGLVDIALDDLIAFEFVIDVSSWYEWGSVSEPCWVQVHFQSYTYETLLPRYWMGKIDFPPLEVRWGGQ